MPFPSGCLLWGLYYNLKQNLSFLRFDFAVFQGSKLDRCCFINHASTLIADVSSGPETLVLLPLASHSYGSSAGGSSWSLPTQQLVL